jgi:TatD DNase family protein
MIIDSHCHLHDPAFEDARAMVTRSADHHVWGVIGVGCDPATNNRILDVAARNKKAVWPALGFHPEWAALSDDQLTVVESQIAVYHPRMVALGEVGLPWYSLEGQADAASLMARGRERFARLLALAARFDLPVIVHAPHGAAELALAELRARGIERAVFHWHKASRRRWRSPARSSTPAIWSR